MKHYLIAVVDDDESVLFAVTSLIVSMGFDAEPFGSATALLSADPNRFACIVTDIQMPAFTGIQLKERLDSLGFAGSVIMITSRNEPEIQARALACHPFCLLQKPFDGDVLQGCLERALEI